MCATCGCSDDSRTTLSDLQTGAAIALNDPDGHGHSEQHDHSIHGHHHGHEHGRHSHDGHTHTHDHGHGHTHEHGHAHGHTHVHGTTMELEKAILTKNNQLAERNRGWFLGRNILALN